VWTLTEGLCTLSADEFFYNFDDGWLFYALRIYITVYADINPFA